MRRERQTVKEKDGESKGGGEKVRVLSATLFPRSLHHAGLCHSEVRRHELQLGFLHGWQGPQECQLCYQMPVQNLSFSGTTISSR